MDVSRQQVADVLHHPLVGIHPPIDISLHAVIGLLRAVDGDLYLFQVPLIVSLLHRIGIQQIAVADHRRGIVDTSLLQSVDDEVDNGLVVERFAAKPPDAYLLAATMLDDVVGRLLRRLLRHRPAGLSQLVAVEAAGVAVAGGHDGIAGDVWLRGFHQAGHVAELLTQLAVVVILWHQKPMADQFGQIGGALLKHLLLLVRQQHHLFGHIMQQKQTVVYLGLHHKVHQAVFRSCLRLLIAQQLEIGLRWFKY